MLFNTYTQQLLNSNFDKDIYLNMNCQSDDLLKKKSFNWLD